MAAFSSSSGRQRLMLVSLSYRSHKIAQRAGAGKGYLRLLLRDISACQGPAHCVTGASCGEWSLRSGKRFHEWARSLDSQILLIVLWLSLGLVRVRCDPGERMALRVETPLAALC